MISPSRSAGQKLDIISPLCSGMDISDVLRAAGDLLLVRDERRTMMFEDDRSQLCRSLEAAQRKIVRLTRCLKSASDDYDELLKAVRKSSSSGTSKKRPSEDVAKMGSKVRIAEVGVSPIKAANAPTALPTNVVSALKRSIVSHDKVESEAFASSPPSSAREDSSQESVDYLNVGADHISPQRAIEVDHYTRYETTEVRQSATVSVSHSSSAISDSLSTALNVVPKSKKALVKTSLSSAKPSTTSSNQLVMKPKPQSTVGGGPSLGGAISVGGSAPVAPSLVLPGSHGPERNYPSLDMVGRTSGVSKLQRSSSSHSSTATSASVAADRTKTSGQGAVSHDRRSENYKCIDVVRKKSEREALPGHTCFECAAFYEAMKQQGVMTEEGMQEHLRQCSRHKAKFAPPSTPEGFWDLTIHTPEDWK